MLFFPNSTHCNLHTVIKKCQQAWLYEQPAAEASNEMLTDDLPCAMNVERAK